MPSGQGSSAAQGSSVVQGGSVVQGSSVAQPEQGHGGCCCQGTRARPGPMAALAPLQGWPPAPVRSCLCGAELGSTCFVPVLVAQILAKNSQSEQE